MKRRYRYGIRIVTGEQAELYAHAAYRTRKEAEFAAYRLAQSLPNGGTVAVDRLPLPRGPATELGRVTCSNVKTVTGEAAIRELDRIQHDMDWSREDELNGW
jgi:hypothetical protein